MNRIKAKRTQLLDALAAARHRPDQQGMVVAQLMTTTPHCISVESTALDLVKLLQEKKFRHVLVIDDTGRLVGVVSDRDVIGCISPIRPPTPDELREVPTRRLMSTDLLTAPPTIPLEEAVSLMLKHGISCLPVVFDDELLGIVTSTDLHILLQLLLESTPSVAPEHLLARCSTE